jgi:acetoin utilization protein AcuB
MFTLYGLNGHELMPPEAVLKRKVEKASEIVGDSVKINDPTENKRNETYKAVNQLSPKIDAVVAKHIMSSPVVTLTPNTTLKEALAQFSKNNVRHFPVVSLEGRLVGIISERDVLRYLSRVSDEARSAKEPLLTDEITEMMQGKVLAANPDTDIRYIARLFVEQGIGAMPIVSEAGLKGIITRRDVLSAVMRYYAIELWA